MSWRPQRLRLSLLALLLLGGAAAAAAQPVAQPQWVLVRQWQNASAQACDSVVARDAREPGRNLTETVRYLFNASDFQTETVWAAEKKALLHPWRQSLRATLCFGWSNPPTPLAAGDDLTLTFRRTWVITREPQESVGPRVPWVLEFAAVAVCGPDGEPGRLSRACAINPLNVEDTQYVWRAPAQMRQGETVLVVAGINTPAGRRVTNCWLYQPQDAKEDAVLPDLEQIGASLTFIPRREPEAILVPVSVRPEAPPPAVAAAPEPAPVALRVPLYTHPQNRWRLTPGDGWSLQPGDYNDTLQNPSANLRLVIWRQSLPFAGGVFPVLENEVNGWLAAHPQAKPQYVELGSLPAMQCALPGGDGWLLSFCVGQRLYRAWGVPITVDPKAVDCALPLKVMQTLQVEP